ncbi:MAG: OmpA family protein [Cytophagaceae bacterium]
MNKIKYILFAFLFFQTTVMYSQLKVAGVWQGIITQPGGPLGFANYPFWMTFNETSSEFTGHTRCEVPGTENYYNVIEMKGKVYPDHIFFEEIKITESKMPPSLGGWCIKSGTLYYTQEKNMLKGKWAGGANGAICMPGEIIVYKSDGNVPQGEVVPVTPTPSSDFESSLKSTGNGVGKTFVMDSIYFMQGKSALTPQSQKSLDKIAKILKDNPSVRMRVSGHTDNNGNDVANLQLSKDRAKAVVDYLVKKGITKSRLFSEGYGKSIPRYPNDTEENRKKNRRVEFEIVK